MGRLLIYFYTNTMIKAVIFDVDNTLYLRNKAFEKILQMAVDKLQVQEIPVIFPSPDKFLEVEKKNLPFENIFKEFFPGMYAGEILAELVLKTYREIAPNVPYDATPHALEAIETLKKQGIVIGLVTNRVRMLSERLIEAKFDPNDFAFMCMPLEKEFAKPHPRAFEVALQELKKQGIGPAQTIMIGDHEDDYYSSFYQNIPFVGILQGYTTKQEFLDIHIQETLIIENLANITELLQRVEKIQAYQRSVYNTSALDGRYAAESEPLHHYFSEYALHKYRVMAEIEHVIALSEFSNGEVVRPLRTIEKEQLRALYTNFSEQDAFEVIEYDHLGRRGIGPVEHDTKACELWIQEKLVGTSLEDISAFIHIFVTSEDIRNLAWKSMLRDATKDIFVPAVLEITETLKQLTSQYAYDPVMGRTHMQPASPTTFGKIFGNYLVRFTRGLERLDSVKLYGKINGAVGNYNSFLSAFQNIDWQAYSKEFTGRLGFECDMFTDQRGQTRDMVETFQAMQEIGCLIRDFAQDMSSYAAFKTMYFSKIESHVGSSVMPHKINPWFAEVAEGLAKKANALINMFSNELDVSRLQRDLSDHELERTYGEAFGAIFIALGHLKTGLDLIRPDTQYAKEELQKHPEIVTEAIQTILRKHGRGDAYDMMKEASRGKKLTLEELRIFVTKLDVLDTVKQEILIVLDPERYIGLASKLAREAVVFYTEYIHTKTI